MVDVARAPLCAVDTLLTEGMCVRRGITYRAPEGKPDKVSKVRTTPVFPRRTSCSTGKEALNGLVSCLHLKVVPESNSTLSALLRGGAVPEPSWYVDRKPKGENLNEGSVSGLTGRMLVGMGTS